MAPREDQAINREQPRVDSLKQRDSKTLQHDIEETRSHLDDTIDAIAARLAPGRMLGDVLGSVRGAIEGRKEKRRAKHEAEAYADSGSSQTADNLRHAVGDNPLPLAMIGAGAAWLLASSMRPDREHRAIARGMSQADNRALVDQDQDLHGLYEEDEDLMYSGSYVDARTGLPYEEAYGDAWVKAYGAYGSYDDESRKRRMKQRAREAADRTQERAQGMLAKARSAVAKATGMASSAKQQAGQRSAQASDQAGQRGQEAMHRTREQGERSRQWMQDQRQRASDRAQETGHWLREKGHEGRQSMRSGYESGKQTAQDHPLAIGAAAAAVGVIAGMLIPESRTERRAMGESREQAMRRARERGSEMLDRGKRAARASATAATEEAHEQGLTPQQLREKARHAAEHLPDRLAGDARESAQEEGLAPRQLGDKVRKISESARDAAEAESRRKENE